MNVSNSKKKLSTFVGGFSHLYTYIHVIYVY
nr:MAG TPA_asm: hypothetical protein [Caudoviricetes sp.]